MYVRNAPARYAPNSSLVPAYCAPATNPDNTVTIANSWIRAEYNLDLHLTLFTILLMEKASMGVPNANPKEARTGLTIICQGIEVWTPSVTDNSEMMAAITKPTISSKRAALISTAPVLVCFVFRSSRVKVVPKEVEHNAAPAANACNTEYPYPKCNSRSEKAIGSDIPDKATITERMMLLNNRVMLVERPASNTSRMRPMYPREMNVDCMDSDRRLAT